MIEGDIKSTDKVLRYMSFDKFMDVLMHSRLFLARADKFDDDFEGSYTTLIYEMSKDIPVESNRVTSNKGIVNNVKELKESAVCSCWTLSKYENMALWKLYGGKNSIAIETTIGAIEHELCQAPNNNEIFSFLKKKL